MAVGTRTAQHFDPVAFDGLLESHGAPTLWRRARVCPCLDPDTGNARIVCPFCVDFPGVLWDSGSAIKILAAGRQRHDQHEDFGLRLQGFTSFSFPSTVTPGHLDRLEILSGRMVVTQRLVRGDVDIAKRSRERLRIAPVFAVEFCEAIVADALVAYVAGTDFAVDDAGAVTWATDAGPDDGVAYTVRYLTRPTYLCWSPQSRDEDGTKQPYRVTVQRLDLYTGKAVGES